MAKGKMVGTNCRRCQRFTDKLVRNYDGKMICINCWKAHQKIVQLLNK